MSICPGWKTKKDPTKEMDREEALEQIGKKKQGKGTKEKEEEAFEGKRPTGSL